MTSAAMSDLVLRHLATLETRRAVLHFAPTCDDRDLLTRSQLGVARAAFRASRAAGGGRQAERVVVEVQLPAGVAWTKTPLWGCRHAVIEPSEVGPARCLPVVELAPEDAESIAASITEAERSASAAVRERDRLADEDGNWCSVCGGLGRACVPPAPVASTRRVHEAPPLQKMPGPVYTPSPRAPVVVPPTPELIRRRVAGRAHQRRKKAGLVFAAPVVDPAVAAFIVQLLNELHTSGLTWTSIGAQLEVERSTAYKLASGDSPVTPWAVGKVAARYYGNDRSALEQDARAWHLETVPGCAATASPVLSSSRTP